MLTPERDGHPRRQVPPLGGGGEERRAIAAAPQPLRGGGREHLGAVAREAGVLHHDHHVGTGLAERVRLAADAGPADQERVDLPAAGGVGRPARGAHRLERHLPQRPAPRFREREHVGHQSTFASVWSSRISSGTASAPSPMIRPAAGRAAARCDSHREARRAELRGLHLERLLLGGHDPLERREPRPGHALVDRDDGRQRELDRLGGALELPLGGAAPGGDVELRNRGDAGESHQVRASSGRRSGWRCRWPSGRRAPGRSRRP